MLLDIIDLSYLSGYKLLLTFEDGSRRIVDLEERLKEKSGEIARQLRDKDYFKQVRVNSETGTIEWPNGADMCPHFLYEASIDAAPDRQISA